MSYTQDVTETGIEKRHSVMVREKGQYVLAFGVIAVMLYAVGFPVFILFFFGVLAFFIWKAFSFESRSETRQIFEFYLSTNEIIRDDGRRWFGFEIQETIACGEAILKAMSAPPPLVHFGLGVLYQKVGDHNLALKNLERSVGETAIDELALVFPSKAIREYVRVLRKIERTPGDSPLTSSAVRSLERIRKNRGPEMLEKSREAMSKVKPELSSAAESITAEEYEMADRERYDQSKNSNREKLSEVHTDRQTISEVLHDIYDQNA